MFDRLFIRFYAFFTVAAIIGALAGLAFVGMGIATYFGMIDTGRSFENIGPLWMIAGGFGIIFGVWVQHSKIKAGVIAAKERVKERTQ